MTFSVPQSRPNERTVRVSTKRFMHGRAAERAQINLQRRRRSVGGWGRPAAHLSLLLGDRVRLGCIALEQDRRPGRRHF